MKRENRLGKCADACGIISPSILLLSTLAAIYSAPWFSWADNALSDLGVFSPSAYLFNGGLIVSGLLMAISGFGLYLNSSGRIPKGGAILFILASAMLSGVGIFTLEERFLHILCAGSFFIISPVAIIMIGAWEMKKGKNGKILIALGILSWLMWLVPWEKGIAINELTAALFIGAFSVIKGAEMVKGEKTKGGNFSKLWIWPLKIIIAIIIHEKRDSYHFCAINSLCRPFGLHRN